MTRLAGIDIAAAARAGGPALPARRCWRSGLVAARLVGSAAARWLGGPGGDRPDKTPPPSLGIPIGGAVADRRAVVDPARARPARPPRRIARPPGSTSCSCSPARSAFAHRGRRAHRVRRPPPRRQPGAGRHARHHPHRGRGAGAIMALETLGVPVAPLLTTLGIGSLAVALALQETLANFFAGLHLLADRPVRPGDYIKIQDGGAEGFVETIGWRSSRLRTAGNNIVVVPNQKLSQAILTNFHLPVANVAMTVAVTVAVDADPEAVEKLLQRRARPRGRGARELRGSQAGGAAGRHHRRRPGLALHPRREGRGVAEAGRPRGAQAAARPPPPRAHRSRGEGKGLPATRKEPPLRRNVDPRPRWSRNRCAPEIHGSDSLTKGIGRASLRHSSRRLGCDATPHFEPAPRLGRRMMTLRNPPQPCFPSAHRRRRRRPVARSERAGGHRPRHREDAGRVPIDAPLPRLLAAR